MRIIHDYPPNFAEIRKVLHPGPLAIFTYGDTIYKPSPGGISEALKAHENIHRVQQADDVEGWWRQYLDDPIFRLIMEIPAHQKEWQRFMAEMPGRKERRAMFAIISKRLSGKLYGNLITLKKAKKVIQNPDIPPHEIIFPVANKN